MTTQTVTLELNNIIPKARPRLTGDGRAYLPRPYRDNQTYLTRLFEKALEPVTAPVRIKLALGGSINRRGDLDNLAGSVLDALVHAKVLENDNLTKVVALNVEFVHSKSPITLVLTIEEIWNVPSLYRPT